MPFFHFLFTTHLARLSFDLLRGGPKGPKMALGGMALNHPPPHHLDPPVLRNCVAISAPHMRFSRKQNCVLLLDCTQHVDRDTVVGMSRRVVAFYCVIKCTASIPCTEETSYLKKDACPYQDFFLQNGNFVSFSELCHGFCSTYSINLKLLWSTQN